MSDIRLSALHFVDHQATSAIRDVQSGLASCMRQHADSIRVADRQERFLEAIDWTLMTDEDCFEGRIREDHLSEEVFYCKVQVDYLTALRDGGYTSTDQQIGWDPTRPFNVAPADRAFVPFPAADIDDMPF